jgi:2,3-bisphosphoglycerate-independent phosphoglycerate mutase
MTADHGNADDADPTPASRSRHTSIRCRFGGWEGRLRDRGTLADVAPTMLGLMGLDVPKEMTGKDLRT